MDSKTKAGIISVVLAVIGLGAGGAVYNFDFSSNSSNNETITDNSVTSGDVINNYITETIIEQAVDNEAIYEIGEEIALDLICEGESVPDGFIEQCIDYWCEYEADYEACVDEEWTWYESLP